MRIIEIKDENPNRRGVEYINFDRIEAIRKDRPLNSSAKFHINIVTYSADKTREFQYRTEEKRDEIFEKLIKLWIGESGERITLE